ncbi:MAG: alanine--tRNA ligase [Magnetococcales bacterium]|nr:alanine--tRNA ligase [Magnetococcales bacterium]MBF0418594.1 alanine--tRNA ligase [Magnetococcales bacterium]
MTGNEIRQRFIDFFKKHGHTEVHSSSLIPQNDPTLLFTNAGMNQFKGIFLGEETPTFRRAVSSQKCLRAGGKHNDLENVGRTARHHTFFEMLGNFSFGDYFKDDAITMAWELVTDGFGLPLESLLVTVYDEDQEAYDIWHKKVGLPKEKIIRIATSDNFWSMGPTGPCGPCSEIFYDHGPDVPGGPPGSPDADGDRFMEIWNLVFMQYDRMEDGELRPLPKPCIDTGAGLERLAAILQGRRNNYDSDLFLPLIQAVARQTGVFTHDPEHVVSLRVIADHLRAVTFLIADGVLPSNEGRGYVLRRIMRRAMRHGRLLGMNEPFLHLLVPDLIRLMGGYFPELEAQRTVGMKVIENEEKRFAQTLGGGLKHLEDAVRTLPKGAMLDGETVFSLYDTYGFPVDLTADILRDRDIGLDMEGFERHMAEQRARARAAWVGSGDERVHAVYHDLRERFGATDFLGYAMETAQAGLLAILKDGVEVKSLSAGEEGIVLVNQTPFYGESGGQVGDTGTIQSANGRFAVSDTRKPLPDVVSHHGKMLQGTLHVDDSVTLTVDSHARLAVRRHHTATHYLHHALRQILGSHVKQAGSHVAADRLRFDFSHFQALDPRELELVEEMVNTGLLANDHQETTVMTPEEAMAAGAMALFGEKYGSEVRVVRIGPTMELCGGTHVKRSGDIGVFRILSESAVSAGVRRIEAVAGHVARQSYQKDWGCLKASAGLLKLPPGQVEEGIRKLLARQKDLERELAKMQGAMSGNMVDTLVATAQPIAGIPFIGQQVTGLEVGALRDLMDRLKDKLGSGIILLALPQQDKVNLVAGVTKDLTKRLAAGDLMRHVAEKLGGKGGGRPDMAQGGGTKVELLPEVMAQIPEWLREKLA